MKFRLLILAIIIGTLLGVAACNLFDDDYVWDDWVTAVMNH